MTYEIEENSPPNQPRTGTIDIVDQVFTVKQGSSDSEFTQGPADGASIMIQDRPEDGPYIESLEAEGSLPANTDFPWGLFCLLDSLCFWFSSAHHSLLPAAVQITPVTTISTDMIIWPHVVLEGIGRQGLIFF